MFLLYKVKRRWDFRITDSKRERGEGREGGGGGEENVGWLSLCQTRANLFNAALNWPPRTRGRTSGPRDSINPKKEGLIPVKNIQLR